MLPRLGSVDIEQISKKALRSEAYCFSANARTVVNNIPERGGCLGESGHEKGGLAPVCDIVGHKQRSFPCGGQ